MTATDEIVKDYQMVRNVGIALATLAFLVAVGRMGNSEMPHEKSRAQDLLIKAFFAFVVLVGDKMIAQGLIAWFGFPTTYLPVFWQ